MYLYFVDYGNLLFLFGTGRCNGNFGGSGKPDDLKYSIYSYGYYTVKMENTL